MPQRSPRTSAPAVHRPPRPVAVIDIGASAIRMAIAEIRDAGEVRTLDTLVQPVSLGREAFETRRLSRKNIERAAEILKQYQRVLREYGITDPANVRVVATSAVREAANRLAFTDRIFVVTGLSVEPIDEAEVNRITYMGITPQLRAHNILDNGRTVVLEVGGGSTELLVVRSGNVLSSDSYRLGSLRMLKTLETARTGAVRRRPILENHIRRALTLVSEAVSSDGGLNMVAIGGDIRIATRLLLGDDWEGGELAEIDVKALSKLTDEIVVLDDDTIVKRYGVSFIEAETLGPALLSYSMLANHFGLKKIFVSDTNLRDGLLHDMAVGGSWTAEFRNQIVRSALSLGRKFHFDEMHTRNVAELSRKLFDQLHSAHQLDSRHEVLLYVAALLHEIGTLINVRSHHKHALYIIKNSELFGLSKGELLQVGLVARYYRRAAPQPSHVDYMSLSRDERVVVSKLAAILRIASALDDTRSGRIREIECVREGDRLVINVPGVSDVSLERIALQQKSSLFRDIYGMSVLLRAGN
ncbi:Ppx/GppA phosphatase family protein [Stieleria varia]|uniref:Exopolyphosphatase n=1 Tax=Stieleria varia TaxID=2528005 RepID=A0A5C6ASW4_9BACT|nr:Ppx/GppA phosphatase family protein [Stieleria varia]TWU02517.1 Exopolyphosphatase [Stieleria varia]